MNKEFYCKSKQIADYFIKHGSNLLRTEKDKGSIVFVFEYDDSIDVNIRQFEIDRKKCMF